MNQSCFSLGFLSQNSLWKLSEYRGYKGIYIYIYYGEKEGEKSVFPKQGVLATWPRDWVESRVQAMSKRPGQPGTFVL